MLDHTVCNAYTVHKEDGSMDAETIIQKIGKGNVRETARQLKLPVATVHAWKRRASVPHWRLDYIKKVAAEMGVCL